jgi:hypothetical protein
LGFLSVVEQYTQEVEPQVFEELRIIRVNGSFLMCPGRHNRPIRHLQHFLGLRFSLIIHDIAGLSRRQLLLLILTFGSFPLSIVLLH